MQARSRLLPDSQSGITSRKCGLKGRPRGFRVPFGTEPGFELRFLLFGGCVKNVSPISSNMSINRAGVQVKSFNMCLL